MHRASVVEVYHVRLFKNNLSSWDKAIARTESYRRTFSLHNILLLAWLEAHRLRHLGSLKCQIPGLRQIGP